MRTQPKNSVSRDLALEILTNIGQGIIATDAEGKVTYYNSFAQEILGYDADYSYGKDFNQIFRIFNSETKVRLSSPVTYVLQLKAPQDWRRTASFRRKAEGISICQQIAHL